MNAVLTVIALILSCAIGIWKMFSRKNEFRRKQAEKAKEDMENAKKETGTPSDFLDSFGKIS